jgi:nucleotide-binding universal stress UspA family protein
MFAHLLIPSDGSRRSARAASAGIALARQLGARITAYRALDPVSSLLGGAGELVDPGTIARIERASREAARKEFAGMAKVAKAAGVPFESIVARAETPYEGIVAIAAKRRCDLIFMASHGRRGLARLLLGSVTAKVLAGAKIPVLIYR